MSSTQVGKSYALAIGLGIDTYERPSQHPYWWVAPSYKQASVGIDLIRELWRPVIRRGPLKSPPYTTEFLSGGRLEFRTWDDPSNLMGTSIAGGGVDEAGLLTPEAQAAISTRRSATLGRLRYIGNPGMIAGPFRKLCSLAETDTTGTYSMHRWTWEDKRNALPLDKAAAYEAFIEQERLSQPEYEFRRLYLAEWTSDEAAVFTNVRECTDGSPASLEGDHGDRQYVLGVDVGQSVDYLVACAMDIGSGRCDYMERFRGIGYPQAAERLKYIQDRLGAPMVVEVNGPGVALVQELERRGVAYVPFTTTSQSKQEIILNLAANFQQKRISLAEMPPLQYELEVFRYNRMPSGVYRYEAPAGEHDDTVMALALANWGKSRSIGDVEDYGWL
jgi:hypothetical protein